MDEKKEHGRHARSGEFARYDQVDKVRDYRLAEADGEELFDDDFRVRTCDLGRSLRGDAADRRRFAAELGAAMEEIGFAILVGHGVDPALYSAAEQWVLDFFAGAALEDKLRFRAARHGSVSQGYFPLEETSGIHPDLVEGWVFCRRAFALAGRSAPLHAGEFWPLPEFEPHFRRLVEAQLPLFRPIMQAILQHLGCDPRAFDRKLEGTNFGLRLNAYPPIGADARPVTGRLLGHEDVDLFTLLPAPRIEGLQVLSRAGKWVRLQAPPGSIVLNTGDYLQRISNDVFPSTTHRVSPPRDAALRSQPRVSFPLAAYLWEDEILEVLPGLGPAKYEPIRVLTFHTRTTAKFYGDDYAVEDGAETPR
ncbi:MAG TPA: 2OG-Fe(II) oxygenase family protein [Planctomycetota bacterium]